MSKECRNWFTLRKYKIICGDKIHKELLEKLKLLGEWNNLLYNIQGVNTTSLLKIYDILQKIFTRCDKDEELDNLITKLNKNKTIVLKTSKYDNRFNNFFENIQKMLRERLVILKLSDEWCTLLLMEGISFDHIYDILEKRFTNRLADDEDLQNLITKINKNKALVFKTSEYDKRFNDLFENIKIPEKLFNCLN